MKRILIFLVCAAALAAGCTRSELQTDDALAAQGKVRVSLTVKATESPIVATKADPQTADEALVGNLWVFVCQADGTLVEGSEVASFDPDANQGDVVLKSGTDLTIYAFTNVTNAVETQLTAWAANPTGVTSAQLEALTIGHEALTDTPLPMWGKDPGVTINSSKVDHEIALTRSCARFDAAVAAAGDGLDDFVLEGIVWVGGAADKATLYPDANSPVVPTATTSYAPHTVPARSAYAFENAISTDADAMHLIVKGTYKGIVGYYKLAVRYGTAPNYQYDVERNTIYSFTIKKVNAPGFATTAEAAANNPQNISYDVAVTDVEAHDLMVSNGQYYLGLTNSEFVAYSDDAATVVLTTVMHNADASKVTTAGTVDVLNVSPAGSLTLVGGTPSISIPVADPEVDVIGRLASNFQSAMLRIRLGNLYQEVGVRRTASLAGTRSVVSDFSGSDYVVAEKTAAAPWLQLGTNASTFVAAQKINTSGGVYVRADPTTTAPRTAELYLGRKSGGRVKAYMEQSVPWLQVGNLVWATGNLVATTGGAVAPGTNGSNVRIGARTDGGLYFQFGSLVGWKGGALASGGTGVGANPYKGNGTQWWGDTGNPGTSAFTTDAMTWPVELTTTPTGWPSNDGSTAGDRTGLSNYYFNYNAAPYSTVHQDIRGFAVPISGDRGSGTLADGRYAPLGVGDPCTYYLGAPWRQPTAAEHKTLFNGVANNTAWGSVASWAWQASPAGAKSSAAHQLFFPASGYRTTSNGAFYGVGANGNYWSSSVGSATTGYYLYFHSSYVYPQNSGNRSCGYSARCVADALAADRTNVVIPLGGGSETVNVSTFNGASWTATAVGDGLSVSSGLGSGDGPITVGYPLLGSGCRAGTVTLRSGSATVVINVSQREINPPAAGDHVTVNGLKWATGNLVAVDNCGCKVGAPTDHGLYFQFGSLVGWKGGANGTGVGANPYTGIGTQWWGGTTTNPGANIFATDAMTWPVEMTSTPSGWPNADAANKGTLSDYYFNYSVAPWATAGADIRGFAVPMVGDLGSGTLADGRYAPLGVGDPCTYYLGAPWRQPTAAECRELFNGVANGTLWGSVADWAWQASPAGAKSNDLFFPASGFRYTNGAFHYAGTYGRYWSSSVHNATLGYLVYINKDDVYPPGYYLRSNGVSTRCVSSVP